MRTITILAIGKIKEPHFREALLEYEKRLKPYITVSSVEIKHIPFNDKNKKEVIKEENEKLLKTLDQYKDAHIIVLDSRGILSTSEEFANILIQISKPIVFVIGGSLGLEDTVRKKAHTLLSLSKMTLPHELARVVLIEQIYRGVMINNNRSYHY